MAMVLGPFIITMKRNKLRIFVDFRTSHSVSLHLTRYSQNKTEQHKNVSRVNTFARIRNIARFRPLPSSPSILLTLTEIVCTVPP